MYRHEQNVNLFAEEKTKRDQKISELIVSLANQNEYVIAT